jgi:hypothetical protein
MWVRLVTSILPTAKPANGPISQEILQMVTGRLWSTGQEQLWYKHLTGITSSGLCWWSMKSRMKTVRRSCCLWMITHLPTSGKMCRGKKTAGITILFYLAPIPCCIFFGPFFDTATSMTMGINLPISFLYSIETSIVFRKSPGVIVVSP